jgi:hypothetical protein
MEPCVGRVAMKLEQRKEIYTIIEEGELAGLGDHKMWENEEGQLFKNNSQVVVWASRSHLSSFWWV